MRIQFILFLLLVQCTVKPEAAQGDGLTSNRQAHEMEIAVYRDSLNVLAIDPASCKRALDIFTRNFNKSNPDQCDQAFKSFLEFQAKLIDRLNEQLYKHRDFEKFNTLIWADQTLHDSVALKFEEQLHHHDLEVHVTEGTIYIGRTTDPIRKTFFNHLSPPTQLFFNQFEWEENLTDSEDGGLIITTIELADRLGFWENFLKENPNHLFNEFASNNIRYDRYFLMDGMDNTPAFDFESKKLLPEFERAFIHYKAKYSQTSSATILKAYRELLARENNQRTSNVVEFLNQYVPWK